MEEDRKEGRGRDVDSFQLHTHSIVYLIPSFLVRNVSRLPISRPTANPSDCTLTWNKRPNKTKQQQLLQIEGPLHTLVEHLN